MNALLKKEWLLAMHPAAICFLFLAALVLVPNYPYYVTFFYTSLGIFFICLTGRENRDAEYSLLLPAGKSDVVKGRFLTALLLEIITLILAVPFAMLRQQMPVAPNAVGMEANIAFFGFSLIMLGIFNYIFFVSYYKDIKKVGKSFVISSVVMFLYIAIAETLTHIVPFMKDHLDTMDPQFLTEKIVVLMLGILLFAVFTFAAYRRSVHLFEKQDL